MALLLLLDVVVVVNDVVEIGILCYWPVPGVKNFRGVEAHIHRKRKQLTRNLIPGEVAHCNWRSEEANCNGLDGRLEDGEVRVQCRMTQP